MTRNLLLALVSGLGLLGIGTEDEPGWLALALANTDPDVDAAIVAYEDEDYEAASEHLDAAVARRGERAELYYDRGLILVATGDLEGARERFQNGTLSEVPQVRASSHYQLGNLALAQEQWDAAIAAYIDCLRVQPEHENAKWNLELARQRKREQEEREKQEQDQQQQEQQDQQGEQGEQDQQQQDQQQDQQDQQQGEQDQQEQDQQGEQGQQDQQQQDQQQGEQDQQQPQDQQQGEQDQQQQDQPQPQPGEQQQAQPVDAGDLDAALDELDRQDTFMFGRPRGSKRKVEKDW